MANHHPPPTGGEPLETGFSPLSVHTDMALEARDAVRGRSGREIPGVRVEEREEDGVRLTTVEVFAEPGATLLGKPLGHYVTIDAPTFKERDPDLRRRLTEVLAAALSRMVGSDLARSALVVGLGNWNATPDALGPRVAQRVMITRHLQGLVPDDLRGRMRPVAAVAPGVLGTTGIETLAVIRGIVREIHPDVVIAVDALAARGLKRLLASIQLADTGIHPGSGVGNQRLALTEDQLGVPVIGLGVPTVVQAGGIALEAINLLAQSLRTETRFFGILEELRDSERKGLLDAVLESHMGDLMVTPKEVDVLVDDMAAILAEALNRALQPRLEPGEWI